VANLRTIRRETGISRLTAGSPGESSLERFSQVAARSPRLPALPEALGLLRSVLSEPVVDLADLAAIVRGDIGLVVGVLRLGSDELGPMAEPALRVSDLLVHLGVDRLKTMASLVPAIPAQVRPDPELDRCERFWRHARLRAVIAERLAGRGQISNLYGEYAYLAGLVRDLALLPALLSWTATEGREPELCGRSWGRTLNLPSPLTDVVRGDRAACGSSFSRALLELADEADKHAFRLELSYH
jgi:hypothetical protein